MKGDKVKDEYGERTVRDRIALPWESVDLGRPLGEVDGDGGVHVPSDCTGRERCFHNDLDISPGKRWNCRQMTLMI